MVSQSKNEKLYIFQKNGFSIKKWKTIYFSKKWFLNQKMVTLKLTFYLNTIPLNNLLDNFEYYLTMVSFRQRAFSAAQTML